MQAKRGVASESTLLLLQIYIAAAAATAVVIAVLGTYVSNYLDAASPAKHKKK